MSAPDEAREELIDDLLDTDLIAGYDWLGTDSSYPSEKEIRSEIAEAADHLIGLGYRKRGPVTDAEVEAYRRTFQAHNDVVDDPEVPTWKCVCGESLAGYHRTRVALEASRSVLGGE